MIVQRVVSIGTAAALVAGLVTFGSAGLREIAPGEADGLVGGTCGTFSTVFCFGGMSFTRSGQIGGSGTCPLIINQAFQAGSGGQAVPTGTEWCGINSGCNSTALIQGLDHLGCGN